MPQSVRSWKIEMRCENVQEMKYNFQPLSLYDSLRIAAAKSSVQPYHSMRCVPSQEISDHFLKRQLTARRDRKVRFAMFDAMHMYEPGCGSKEDLWWSQDELNEYRALERKCTLEKSEQIYLNAYNEAFREISLTNTISMPMKLKLVAGCSLGFIGLQNIVSTEWRCTRRLDIRCIVASVILEQRRLLLSTQFTSIDVAANILASHSEQLTRSHRMWSAVIGEAQKIAVEIS
jgi:hypothetical protein